MQNYCGNSKPTSQIYFESFRNNFRLKRNMFDASKGNSPYLHQNVSI